MLDASQAEGCVRRACKIKPKLNDLFSFLQAHTANLSLFLIKAKAATNSLWSIINTTANTEAVNSTGFQAILPG